MALFGRSGRRDATPAVPAAPSHAQTVAGLPVEVRTPPGAVDARLTGYLGRSAFAVRPRERSGAEVPVPPAATGLLDLVDRSGHPIATDDAAFDARYEVVGGEAVRVLADLTDPLRARLLAVDVVFLVVHSGGAWVGVAHTGPAATGAELAALDVLQLLAPA